LDYFITISISIMSKSSRPSVFPLALLATAAIASPLILTPRAGAPIPKPIPSNCTIANPVLCTSAAYCPPVSYSAYRPTNATLTPEFAGPFLYGYYLQPDSFQVINSNSSALFQTCLETCYGYGNIGDCKSVYQAYNYPTPPMYARPLKSYRASGSFSSPRDLQRGITGSSCQGRQRLV
jgi:hypothetical protein